MPFFTGMTDKEARKIRSSSTANLASDLRVKLNDAIAERTQKGGSRFPHTMSWKDFRILQAWGMIVSDPQIFAFYEAKF